MSDNTQRPHTPSGQPDHTDLTDMDNLDVPTYTGGTTSSNTAPTGDIYERTGRAAPENIQPEAPATEAIAVNRNQPVAGSSTSYNAAPAYADTSYNDTAYAGETYTEPVAPVEEKPLDPRRGTIDLGLLLLRVLLGGLLILQSVSTFFRLGGNEGLSGLEAEFANYTFGNILAIGVPTAQLAAGVFLVLGLLTPVAAMVATIVTGFTALHALATEAGGFNVFGWSEAVWLSLILLGLSVVLQFTGPGLYSFDTGRSWARRPLASSWVFIVLGIAAVVALWIFGTGVNPLA